MEPTQEQLYQQRIAALEAENASLREQLLELQAQMALVLEQNAKLSKNSSNSSKPPSSDIVKPPKPPSPSGPRTTGGQPGHPGAHHQPFSESQLNDHWEQVPTHCPPGHLGNALARVSAALAPAYQELAARIPAEPSIRHSVLNQRLTQGSRSEKGRRWNERIFTVLGTCRKQGRSAWQFIREALSAHYFSTPMPSLVPQTT